MSPKNLEAALQLAGNDPVQYLRNRPVSYYKFPYPDEHTNWREEEEAWNKTAALFDQSNHMWDVYLKGPDAKRLLSDTGINNFTNFGKNKAKQFVAVNPRGYVIGDAILFAFEEDYFSLVGTPAAADWVEFRAETGDYDVEVIRDEAAPFNSKGRKLYRYELQGPNTRKILEKAVGGPLDRIKFFNIGEFTINGMTVKALNHTMSGVPGRELTGLELWGPAHEGEKVRLALIEAGEEFDLKLGGAQAYVAAGLESGWIALPTPAVYSGDDMKAYREWLPGDGFEANASIAGSFASPNIEDYYLTPWDLGYGHLIHFDHEFIGRDALKAMADKPHRRKVWLRWNNEDAAKIWASSLFDGQDRAKYLNLPNAVYGISQYDKLLADGRTVGIAAWSGYSVNIGSISSLAMVDEADAIEGRELTLVWGEEGGSSPKPFVERHVQKDVRVTLSLKSLASHT
jgi:vanillate/3-O-methylgallate O-demethylase